MAKAAEGKLVEVEGRVVQQCPGAGCWFLVEDGTGKVLVDLNPLGARLKRERVGEMVRVMGRIVRVQGQLRIGAEFVEFRGKDSPDEDDPAAGDRPGG